MVSTCAELPHARRALPAATVDRLEAACREGGSSLFATGSSPGFISDVVPIALLLLERSLDRIVIEEFADLSQRPSPKLLFEVMGMGRRPAAVDERRAEHMRTSFGPALEALAERIGLPIDRVEARTEVAVTTRPVTIAAGDIDEDASPRSAPRSRRSRAMPRASCSAPPGTAPMRSMPTGTSVRPDGA